MGNHADLLKMLAALPKVLDTFVYIFTLLVLVIFIIFVATAVLCCQNSKKDSIINDLQNQIDEKMK